MKQNVTLCNIWTSLRNDDIDLFINDIKQIMGTLSLQSTDKMFVGDYNIDVLKIKTKQKHGQYLDIMLCSGFPQPLYRPKK